MCRQVTDEAAFIQGNVNGVDGVNILLDTGSPISLVSSRSSEELKIKEKLEYAEPCILRGVSGGGHNHDEEDGDNREIGWCHYESKSLGS